MCKSRYVCKKRLREKASVCKSVCVKKRLCVEASVGKSVCVKEPVSKGVCV